MMDEAQAQREILKILRKKIELNMRGTKLPTTQDYCDNFIHIINSTIDEVDEADERNCYLVMSNNGKK